LKEIHMAKPFVGSIRIRMHADKGVTLDRGIATSTLTAGDVDKILELSLEAATANKAGLDRWSFYVRGESENLKGDTIDPKVVRKALASGLKPTLVAAKFGKPAVWIQPDLAPKAKTTKYVDIA
jgi:hypothetical protein